MPSTSQRSRSIDEVPCLLLYQHLLKQVQVMQLTSNNPSLIKITQHLPKLIKVFKPFSVIEVFRSQDMLLRTAHDVCNRRSQDFDIESPYVQVEGVRNVYYHPRHSVQRNFNCFSIP